MASISVSYNFCSWAVGKVSPWRKQQRRWDTGSRKRRRGWCSQSSECCVLPPLCCWGQIRWWLTIGCRHCWGGGTIKEQFRRQRPFWCCSGAFAVFDGAHSVNGVHTVYQGCCLTHKKVKVWKPKEMRICVITDISNGAEMRPDGGRQETKSFQAAFRLTANRHDRVKQTKINTKEPEGGKKNHHSYVHTY